MTALLRRSSLVLIVVWCTGTLAATVQVRVAFVHRMCQLVLADTSIDGIVFICLNDAHFHP